MRGNLLRHSWVRFAISLYTSLPGREVIFNEARFNCSLLTTEDLYLYLCPPGTTVGPWTALSAQAIPRNFWRTFEIYDKSKIKWESLVSELDFRRLFSKALLKAKN
jgi:hypothetical protein